MPRLLRTGVARKENTKTTQKPQPDSGQALASVNGSPSDAARWRYFASSPQTALMLDSKLDPNDESVDWVAECNRLADAQMPNDKLTGSDQR
jgi:hypothetical protein